MKIKAIWIVFVLAGLIVISSAAFVKNKRTMKLKDQTTITAPNKFAVLELFTSEGCSSCPPADELMVKIQNEYKDQPVYLLSFHVDYWDRLGWKDVFSNHDYTTRQSAYGDLFKLNSIYTPQLVINGNAEMIGSDALRIRTGISKALTTEPATELLIEPKQADNILTLDYRVNKVPEDNHLLIAVIQKSAKIKVERGENGGRLLTHIQIVRSLKSESLNKNGNGTTAVQLPEGFNKTEWEVIALIQNINTGAICAATRVNF